MFPLTWKFFVSFATDYLTFMPRIEPAFSLYIKMLLAFGAVFQMPTIVLFLAKMGVVTAGFLWKHTKFAFLIIVIISAVVTPDGGGVSLVAMCGAAVLSLPVQHRARLDLRQEEEDGFRLRRRVINFQLR